MKVLSLFANIGVAEAYLHEIGQWSRKLDSTCFYSVFSSLHFSCYLNFFRIL